MEENNNEMNNNTIPTQTNTENMTQTQNINSEQSNVPEYSMEWQDLSGGSNLSGSKRKVKKGAKVLITLIVILVLLVAGALAYFKFFKADSEDIYMGLIKDIDSDVTEEINKGIKEVKEDSVASGNISISTNMEEIKDLNGISLDYALKEDSKDKSILANIAYKEAKKDILDANIYVKDKTLYIDSKQIFSKTLLIKDDSVSIGSNITDSKEKLENTKYAVNKTSRYLAKAFENAEYKTEYGKVSVNGKKAFAQKNIMNVSSKTADRIKNSFLTSIKNDDKYLESLGIPSKEGTTVKSVIDQMTSQDTSANMKDASLEIDTNIFTNKLLRFEYKYDQKKLIEVTKVADNTYKVVLYDENDSYEGTLKVRDDNMSFEITIGMYSYLIEASEENDNAKMSIKVTSNNKEYFNIKFTKNSDKGKTIKPIDTKKAVDMSKLTEQDVGEIENNISKLMEKSNLIKALSSASSYNSISAN